MHVIDITEINNDDFEFDDEDEDDWDDDYSINYGDTGKLNPFNTDLKLQWTLPVIVLDWTIAVWRDDELFIVNFVGRSIWFQFIWTWYCLTSIDILTYPI